MVPITERRIESYIRGVSLFLKAKHDENGSLPVRKAVTAVAFRRNVGSAAEESAHGSGMYLSPRLPPLSVPRDLAKNGKVGHQPAENQVVRMHESGHHRSYLLCKNNASISPIWAAPFATDALNSSGLMFASSLLRRYCSSLRSLRKARCAGQVIGSASTAFSKYPARGVGLSVVSNPVVARAQRRK